MRTSIHLCIDLFFSFVAYGALLPPPKSEEVVYLSNSVRVCVSVCAKYLKKLWRDSDEILWGGGAWPRVESIRFWWWSGFFRGSRIIFRILYHLQCVSANYERTLMNFSVAVARGQKINRLDFGDDRIQYSDPRFLNPDPQPDPEIFRWNRNFWRVSPGSRHNRLDFGGDLNYDLDPGFLNPHDPDSIRLKYLFTNTISIDSQLRIKHDNPRRRYALYRVLSCSKSDSALRETDSQAYNSS